MLGNIIKKLRVEQKLTQKDLAKKIGVSESAVSMYERNEREPNMEIIKNIANVFDVEINKLYEDERFLSVKNIIPLEKVKRIPILGTICAGNGIWCEENFDDYIMIDRHIRADFALVIRGDSMIEANIHDGDIAFFKKTNYVDDGKIAAVLLKENNEATLKKIYKSENGYILQACNSKYPPIISKDVLIMGELKGIYKELK